MMLSSHCPRQQGREPAGKVTLSSLSLKPATEPRDERKDLEIPSLERDLGEALGQF